MISITRQISPLLKPLHVTLPITLPITFCFLDTYTIESPSKMFTLNFKKFPLFM
nr:MAG TPA: hypothetical protein [Caudoviricetes sp.]